MKKDNGFTIDFFELCFLAEACIPPVPIARSMFWDKLIDVYYHQLSSDERVRLWDWMGREHRYKVGLEQNNHQVLLFDARYDPSNQYVVKTVDVAGVTTFHSAFLFQGRYQVSTNTSIVDNFIVEIRKIEHNE